MIHQFPDGRFVEYRRGSYDPVVLHLEHRELRPGGTPHNDQWYPVTDVGLLLLQRAGGTNLIDQFAREKRR